MCSSEIQESELNQYRTRQYRQKSIILEITFPDQEPKKLPHRTDCWQLFVTKPWSVIQAQSTLVCKNHPFWLVCKPLGRHQGVIPLHGDRVSRSLPCTWRKPNPALSCLGIRRVHCCISPCQGNHASSKFRRDKLFLQHYFLSANRAKHQTGWKPLLPTPAGFTVVFHRAVETVLRKGPKRHYKSDF